MNIRALAHHRLVACRHIYEEVWTLLGVKMPAGHDANPEKNHGPRFHCRRRYITNLNPVPCTLMICMRGSLLKYLRSLVI